MRSVRKLPYLLLAVVPLSLLSGCWSSIELNNRAFARIIIVDKADKGIELTLGFPLPNRLPAGKPGGGGGGESGGESEKPFTYVSKTGDDIADAYHKIQSDLSRKITFGQTRNILLGQQFVQAGIAPVVDFLAREPELHINANVYVAEGKAKQFATIPVTFERFPSDILTAYAKRHLAVSVTVRDILMSIYSGGDIVLPMLVFGVQGAQFESKGKHWMGTGPGAVLQHGRMVGTLNTKDMRSALWILRQVAETEISVPSPTDNKQISILVQRAATDIKPLIEGEQLTFLIRCKADAAVLASTSNLDVTDTEQLSLLKRSFDQKLATHLADVIVKSKRMHADAFQLGNYIRWRYPGQWRSLHVNWRETYATRVEVKPQVDITLKWFGAAEKPEWNRVLSGSEESQ